MTVIVESHVAHLRDAVTAGTLETVPGAYMVIQDVLPPDMYALLLDTMPPPDGFDIADSVKANFDPEKTTIALTIALDVAVSSESLDAC